MNAEEQLKMEIGRRTQELLKGLELGIWQELVDETADELLEKLGDDDPLTAATAAADVLTQLFDDKQPPDEWRQSALGQLIAHKMGWHRWTENHRRVWTVESNAYPDHRVEGVYSTKEHAELALKSFGDKQTLSDYFICERPLDPNIGNISAGLILYEVYLYPSMQEPPKATRGRDFEDIDSWPSVRHYGESFSSVTVWASDEPQAIELAQRAFDEDWGR